MACNYLPRYPCGLYNITVKGRFVLYQLIPFVTQVVFSIKIIFQSKWCAFPASVLSYIRGVVPDDIKGEICNEAYPVTIQQFCEALYLHSITSGNDCILFTHDCIYSKCYKIYLSKNAWIPFFPVITFTTWHQILQFS